MHIYPWQIAPLSIEHKCLEYCYTNLAHLMASLSVYIEQCTCTYGRLSPLLQSSIDALNTVTPHLAHLMADLYIYIYRTMYIYLWQIDLLQLSIDLCKTLHKMSFRYSTMHIYPWQTDPLLSSIDVCKIITPDKF